MYDRRIILTAVLLILISTFCLAAGKPEPNMPTVEQLLDKYTQALDSTKSFVCHWESEVVVSNNVPSIGLRTNNEKVFEQGQVRTDSNNHLYALTKRWGYLDQRNTKVEKANPQHIMFVVGDNFTYRHDKTPGGHKGSLDYREKDKGRILIEIIGEG